MQLEDLAGQIDQWLTDWQIDRTAPFLIGVSGGVDSMVLLAACQKLQQAGKLKLQVMHINHQLRADADRDQALVVDYCQAAHIDVAVRIWRHGDLIDNVEASARAFRYGNFAQYLRHQGWPYLIVAHHENDAAETTLMRLLHGSGVAAVAGLRPVAPLYLDPQLTVLRPLLHINKAALYACADAAGIPYHEDETNQDWHYTRNRMRHQWLPQLAKENPNVVSHLAAFAEELNALLPFAEQALQALLPRFTSVEEGSGTLDLSQWRTYTALERPLLLRAFFNHLNREAFRSFSRQGLEALSAFLFNGAAQGEWQLPAGYQLTKLYDTALVQQPGPARSVAPLITIAPKATRGLANKAQITRQSAPKPPAEASWLPQAVAEKNLQLRTRQPGDYLLLLTGERQKLRRYFINHKFPAPWRAQALLLTCEQWVLAIIDPHTLAVAYRYPVPTYQGEYWRITAPSAE